MSNLPPEFQAQQQELTRQQRMAELLMGQGTQQPQGQMISGRYVAPSFFQNLLPVVNAYMGSKMSEKADQRSLDLAKAVRGRHADELKQYQEMMNPAPTLAPEQAGPALNAQGQAVPIERDMIASTPDRKAANLMAANAYNPVLQTVGMKELTKGPKWEKAEFTDEKTGVIKQGVIDVNADNPISTLIVGGRKPALSENEKRTLAIKEATLGLAVNADARARNADSRAAQQFTFDTGLPAGGGGMPQGGMPQGGMPQGGMPQGGMPQFQPNPMLSGKQNQINAAKFYEKQNKREDDAKDSFTLLQNASSILRSGDPSSGRLSNIATGIGEIAGYGGKASQADAMLNQISGGLTMKQPRFEGPQGVMDVILYQKLAGDLGNPNLPVATRTAVLQQMVDLQKKYYPDGDWNSISPKAISQQSKTVSVSKPQYATNPQTGERIMSTDNGVNWQPVRGR